MSKSLFERTRLWDAMYGMTKVEVKLIPDPDMYIFFEKGTSGGVSYISNRYGKANNKYLESNDPNQESKHITCLDANNSYGYAMSKFSPTWGFKRINLKDFELNKYNNNSSQDAFLKLINQIRKVVRLPIENCWSL